MATKVVTCPICGRTFETDKSHKLYCSLTCKEAGRMLQRIKWKEENATYYRDYGRARRARKAQAAAEAHHEEQLQSADS